MSRNAARAAYALPKATVRRPELAQRRELLWIPAELLRPNPEQPRREFDENTLRELSRSIEDQGIEQPLLVRPPDESGLHTITDGERRWRAGQLIGLVDYPCYVVAADSRQAFLQAFIANVQRDALTAVDTANAIQHLRRAYELETDDAVASLVQKSVDWVRQMSALAQLDDGTKEILRQRREPVALAMHLRPQRPQQRQASLEAMEALGLQSRDEKVAFLADVNARLRAGDPITEAVQQRPRPVTTPPAARPRRAAGRPARTLSPFAWQEIAEGISTLEIRGRGLPKLYRAMTKPSVASHEFYDAVREALVLLRDECLLGGDRMGEWGQAETLLRPLFDDVSS